MRNTVVVYASNYGATERYAEWIAADLSADIFERKQIKLAQLMDYDTIIYGGGLYAGGISGVSLLVKNFEALKDKNIIVFTCGLADPTDEENIKGIHKGIDKVFSPSIKENITFFHLRGAIDYSKLNFVHKSMMAMLVKSIGKKEESSLSEEEKQILETYGKQVDFIERINIDPLISFIKG